MNQRSRKATSSALQLGFVESLESRQLLSAVTPTQVRHAYGIDAITFTNTAGQTVKGDGSGQTIAIVDAYNDKNIAADLKTFDATYGLSDTDASGNFALSVANMSSTTPTDPGWAQETSLDVEWAHAIAPKAHIVLVQAKSSSTSDLLNAVNYARNQSGVVAVSMSWGSSEFSSETYYDSYFTTPSGHVGGNGLAGGISFFASSDDDGAPASWPSVSPNVVAVGGTTLNVDGSGNYLGESAWSGSGGGIATYESKPSYQSSITLSATRRTAPDVSYNADPNTGFMVYDSVPVNGSAGWWQIGGTSAGAPQWAALMAITDQGRAFVYGKGSLDGKTQALPALYQINSGDFHDVTTGSNGYSASAGYDLVSGRGSPVANPLVADLLKATSGTTTTTTTTTTTRTAPAPRSATTAGVRATTSHKAIAVAAPAKVNVFNTGKTVSAPSTSADILTGTHRRRNGSLA